MEAGMSLINDLVRQAREAAQLTMEACSGISDYSVTQIHRYEQGECEVSFRYVSRLFAATGDRRLLMCFNSTVAELIAQMNRPQPPAQPAEPAAGRYPAARPVASAHAGDPRDLIRRELEALEELTRAARYVQQIVGDGAVDESDNVAIGQLLHKHEHVVAIIEACDRALVGYRDESRNK